MSIKVIRERVEESKRLNVVFGPQAQDDLEELLDLVERLGEALCNPCPFSEEGVPCGGCQTCGSIEALLKELEPTE